MAKDDGIIWLSDFRGSLFDFRGSDFSGLDEYLEQLRASSCPSFAYSKSESPFNREFDYRFFWVKKEGFPFQGFEAKRVEHGRSGKISKIIYGPGG